MSILESIMQEADVKPISNVRKRRLYICRCSQGQ